MTSAIAVVGSTGKTGKAVTAALVAAGLETRALTRAEINLETAEGLDEAFAGCSTVYHLAPNLHPLEVEMANNVVNAAQRSGVKRIVFHSVLHPQISAMPHHLAKAKAEEVVVASSLDWAILQPSAYAQNLSESVVGALPYRASAHFSFVDLLDVALAGTLLVRDPTTTFGRFEASGPVTSVAEISSALGWNCNEISLEQWLVRNKKLTEYQSDALTAMFAYYDKHGLVGSSVTLTALLGRAPRHAVDALQN